MADQPHPLDTLGVRMAHFRTSGSGGNTIQLRTFADGGAQVTLKAKSSTVVDLTSYDLSPLRLLDYALGFHESIRSRGQEAS